MPRISASTAPDAAILTEITGEQIVEALSHGLAWLEANKEVINDLNVFPVPDGDTGSNMYMTLRSAVTEARGVEQTTAGEVLRAAAHGSLLGARGNSGVILSQILRGLSDGMGDATTADAPRLGQAFGQAAIVAHRAVMKPKEGTLLTVIRDVARATQQSAEHNADIRELLSVAVTEAHEAVERTIGQLAILKEAGVVDAGGFGLSVILEGFRHSLMVEQRQDDKPLQMTPRSEPAVRRPGEIPTVAQLPTPRETHVTGARSVAMHEEGWGYCTEFLLHMPGHSVAELQETLGAMGESALIVGDDELVRVHIHTHDPASLIAAASQEGPLSHLKVEDMSAQHHAILEGADDSASVIPGHSPAHRKAVGTVAVASGKGFREIFESLGTDVIVEGGQTMNPSTEDILNAIRGTHARSVVVLPNNGNVVLSAEKAQGLAGDVAVEVVATKTLPQGVAAMLALVPDQTADSNVEKMRAAVGAIRTIEVTRAVRDTVSNGHRIKKGQAIALVDDVISAVGDSEDAVITSLLSTMTPAPELVTVYWGDGVSEELAQALVTNLVAEMPNVEFELHHGGQPHYPYVLSLE